MQLRRLMIILAICIVGLVIAALGMYRSWQNFTSGGLFGILSSHGHYMMVDGTSTTVTLDHKAERIVTIQSKLLLCIMKMDYTVTPKP